MSPHLTPAVEITLNSAPFGEDLYYPPPRKSRLPPSPATDSDRHNDLLLGTQNYRKQLALKKHNPILSAAALMAEPRLSLLSSRSPPARDAVSCGLWSSGI